VKPVENPIVIDDAERLVNFQDGTLDFVIANHVFEHCHDPIGTMKNWIRVLKPGGIVYAAIPEKTQTFDRKRAVTPLDHVIADHEHGYDFNDIDHYRDWFLNVENLAPDRAEEKAQQCWKERANIHFHVWDSRAMDELMRHLAQVCGFSVAEIGNNGAEIIWILRKE
jgi:predicted SAM-dependent methyltransferase